MIEENDFNLSVSNEFIVNEPNEFYDDNRDFTTLEAWKKCNEVKLYFYKKILPLLPIEEKYNLDNQIRRAAISTTANIAEGYGRYHYREGLQFYRISRASIYELKDHLISCNDLGYIGYELKNEGEDLIESAKRTLNGFINFVKKKIQNEK
ncbi:MAG TPA: four helix bundle protein [Ignavibacteriaceae bacterium]|nr:four helix bundle protein [Ignavibacteriaceae bacterium]